MKWEICGQNNSSDVDKRRIYQKLFVSHVSDLKRDSVGIWQRTGRKNMKLFASVKLICFNTFAVRRKNGVYTKKASFVMKKGSLSICNAINIRRPNSQRTHVPSTILEWSSHSALHFCFTFMEWKKMCARLKLVLIRTPQTTNTLFFSSTVRIYELILSL